MKSLKNLMTILIHDTHHGVLYCPALESRAVALLVRDLRQAFGMRCAPYSMKSLKKMRERHPG